MTTKPVIAVVGAGPGVGASVAARFAREGFDVALIARHRQRLQELAEALNRAGARTAVATADATKPRELEAALRAVSSELGDPEVLCFSPIPDIALIGPVLETTPDDLIDSLRLNIAGAASAVGSVVPAMRERRSGTLLFTTGSAALTPSPERASSAFTTTAATAYIALLRAALADQGIAVGHTVIAGPIGTSDKEHDPDEVAEDLWRHHTGIQPEPVSVLRLP